MKELSKLIDNYIWKLTFEGMNVGEDNIEHNYIFYTVGSLQQACDVAKAIERDDPPNDDPDSFKFNNYDEMRLVKMEALISTESEHVFFIDHSVLMKNITE